MGLTLDVPGEARAANLTVFLEGRPEGRPLRYRIRLEPLPPIDSVLGVKSRLENLGYFWGTLDESLDAPTQAALRELQKDHELTPTGQPDEKTVAKLAELSGV
jgi:peptidoglycan hydrolase-like protein with peptidoglycan-binding domain